MQPYDLAMVAVLATAAAYGALKGMAWQIASLSSLIASYFVSLRFSAPLAPYFGQRAPLNRFAAMLAIYLVTSLAIWLAFRLVSQAINRIQLKDFDRQIGGLFGAAKGVLLCVAITFFAVSLSEPARAMVLKSRSGYYIALLIDRADPIMPKEIHDVLGPYLRRFEERLDPRSPPPANRPATYPGNA